MNRITQRDLDWISGKVPPSRPVRLAEPSPWESRSARVGIAISILIIVYFAAQLLRAVL